MCLVCERSKGRAAGFRNGDEWTCAECLAAGHRPVWLFGKLSPRRFEVSVSVWGERGSGLTPL